MTQNENLKKLKAGKLRKNRDCNFFPTYKILNIITSKYQHQNHHHHHYSNKTIMMKALASPPLASPSLTTIMIAIVMQKWPFSTIFTTILILSLSRVIYNNYLPCVFLGKYHAVDKLWKNGSPGWLLSIFFIHTLRFLFIYLSIFKLKVNLIVLY